LGDKGRCSFAVTVVTFIEVQFTGIFSTWVPEFGLFLKYLLLQFECLGLIELEGKRFKAVLIMPHRLPLSGVILMLFSDNLFSCLRPEKVR
jgi:hypothetical protein